MKLNGRALVARNVRRLRVEQGISQEKLAADAGVDRSYLGGLERQDENPTVDLLDRVAKALSVSISDLFAQPAPGERPPKPLRAGRRPE
jgi:transcriptional regulator with XRE-family HTH domain